MKAPFSFLLVLAALAANLPCVQADGGREIGFIERFALAKDREKALQELIPGTEDYYYFHCLYLEQQEKWDEQARLIRQWETGSSSSRLRKEIQHRRALLRYDQDPEGSLIYLKDQLGLRFNHERDRKDDIPDFPTTLDQTRISYELFLKEALRRSNDLNQVSTRGLFYLLSQGHPITREQQRDLLRKLQWPDDAKLVQIIADDLASKESRGFGEFEIHKRLLETQLIELAKKRPEVLNSTEYINQRILRLRPNDDINWRIDLPAKQDYLQRVWDFVSALDPAQNSLKVHVLYHLLDTKRQLGTYDRELFVTYLKLPRRVSYIEPKYLNRRDLRNWTADLGHDCSAGTGLPPVGQDLPLVRDYLIEFIGEDENPDRYREMLRKEWLDDLWAETMLLAGKKDAEKWFAILGPVKVQQLRERVDIQLRPQNEKDSAVGDAVEVLADVKGVDQMVVKVYEVNTLNYYLEQLDQIDTAINLDGLVPNLEKRYEYSEPSIRSVRRTYELPELKGKRGVWVIEFIGGGKSSRALIRKGSLQYLSQVTAAGQAFKILNESNEVVKDGAIWLGGKRFAADKNGLIVIPFSNDHGEKTVVLETQGVASLAKIFHPYENYHLDARFYIDREQLLPKKKAKVIVSPEFQANRKVAALDLLEEVELIIQTTTIDGVETTDRVPGFQLFADRASVHEFPVPDRLAEIRFELTAKVERLSRGDTVDVSSAEWFGLSGINQTAQTRALFLTRFQEDWVVDLLGKNGEPIANAPLNCYFDHLDFHGFHIDATLKTDANGRAILGKLEGIEEVEIEAPGTLSGSWALPSETRSRPYTITGKAGEKIGVPIADDATQTKREDVALFSLRQDALHSDQFDKISFAERSYILDDLEPGDYLLLLRSEGEAIEVHVSAGEEKEGHVLGEYRHLELSPLDSTALVSLQANEEDIRIQLAGANPLTRVHVVADRFFPEYQAYDYLEKDPPFLKEHKRGKWLNSYVSGRTLGEEHRYIIERRDSQHYPGNMLERAGLLLNPWELRSSETQTRQAAAGDEYEKQKMGEPSQPTTTKEVIIPPPGSGGVVEEESKDYAFLANASTVAHQPGTRRRWPDHRAARTTGRPQLGAPHRYRPHADQSKRDLFLAEQQTQFQDLRLSRSLDPARAFAQKKQTSILQQGEELELGSTEFRLFDDISDLHGLFLSLGIDEEKLGEFAFLLNWNELDAESKRAKYSEYACHELNFFLSRRDPAFFDNVVKPYLASKRDKTFLDEYLLEQNLERHLQLYEFGRLNTVEKLLLARRLGGDVETRIKRHVLDAAALLPFNPMQAESLFESALRSRSIKGNDSDGLDLAVVEMRVAGRFARKDVEKLQRQQLNVEPDELAAAILPAAKPEAALNEGLEELESKLGSMTFGLEIEASDRQLRDSAKQLYRKLDATKVWAENNYYHIPIARQVGDYITVNAFWRDYAAWNGQGGFFSPNFTRTNSNLSEMIYAISLLGLPDQAGDHNIRVENDVLKITAGSAVVVFHQEVQPVEVAENPPPLLVSQNFFDPENRFVEENGERTDQFVTEEFLAGKAYGCQIVVTNPTSSRQNLNLFTQIPEGSLPLAAARVAHSRNVAVEPYSTQRFEYYFYFPAAEGNEPHYPVQLVRNDERVATGDAFVFNVVDKLSQIDTASWEYISQWGTDEQVLKFLSENNLGTLNLSRIAWRVNADAGFLDKALKLLSDRGVYDATLWSYGIHHNRAKAIREYLLTQESYLDHAGLWVDSPLVLVDPVMRHRYQHLSYAPVVNARSHRLGAKRKIMNPDLWGQYTQFVKFSGYQKTLDSEQHLAAAYYLFLQDRTAEALGHFAQVKPADISENIQHDYLTCHAAFYEGDTVKARQIATRYADYPVDKWRNRFATVVDQLNEIDQAKAEIRNEKDRDQVQNQLAAAEATFDLEVEDREIRLTYRNLKSVQIHFYEMDLEFLFSSNPFVSSESDRFSMIRPNSTKRIQLPVDANTHTVALPAEYRSSNVLVEVVGGGRKKAKAYYAHSLDVAMSEDYGQVQVFNQDGGDPLPRTYVKVYARFTDGSVRFYKDGYTDLRGKFDYTSLNTNEIERVIDFAVLVSHDDHGSLVKEVKPPNR